MPYKPAIKPAKSPAKDRGEHVSSRNAGAVEVALEDVVDLQAQDALDLAAQVGGLNFSAAPPDRQRQDRQAAQRHDGQRRGQPAEVRELLLRTSILENVTGPLADHLLGTTGSEHTLEEVGQHFAVTRERIRQIEAKALAKLRKHKDARKLHDYIK